MAGVDDGGNVVRVIVVDCLAGFELNEELGMK